MALEELSNRSTSSSRGRQEGEEKEGEEKERERTRSKTGSPSRSRSRSSRRVSRRSESREKRSRSRSRGGRGRRSGSRSDRRSGSRSERRVRRSRSGSRTQSPEDERGYRVHVADLNEECRKKDLERMFMKYGPLKEIWLASYAPFYAFIVYRHKMDAQEASEDSDGMTIAGRRVRVSLARPRQQGPRNRFIPDKFARSRDDYSRRDSRDYDSRDSYRGRDDSYRGRDDSYRGRDDYRARY